jgi:hypothetical protein
MHRRNLFAVVALLATHIASAQTPSLPDRIRQFDADLTSLETFYPIEWSEPRCARFQVFFDQQSADLAKVDVKKLKIDDQIDAKLLANYIESRENEIALLRTQSAEIKPLVPFQQEAAGLEEARVATHPFGPEESAKILQRILEQAQTAQTAFNKSIESGVGKPPASVAKRAASRVDAVSRILADWYREFDGFVPTFSWWCKKPFDDLRKTLADYSSDLRHKGAGFVDGQDAPLIGDPIGRDAYVKQMKTELLGISPEEMIARAEKEADWCHAELKKASNQMGFGDDWKKALDKVKQDHGAPGEQAATISGLENEVIEFVTARDLLTVEPITRESWTWTMTSTQDEKTWPFPTYGFYKVMVPYATADMDQKTKEQVFRGNGIHFLRNVVPHELIPGHHLQMLAASKYAGYRSRFSTPFLIEGWAFYWEMRLWDLGWPKSPEDRIGMLFWRLHRCARVIVSTRFHLGQITPPQMIDYLINEVGHEPEMAKAEVRRYLAGDYSPLYQCAYQVGALALKDLHEEIVVKGGMTEKLFHDTIVKQGAIPVSLIGEKLRSMVKKTQGGSRS